MAPPALRALEHHARVYRRTWRGTAASSVLSPVFFLAALGLGLGGLVRGGTGRVDGVPYVEFLAPGLLAATVMQEAIGESTWPVMSAIKWVKTYAATLSTPLGVGDVFTGHLGWIAIRLATTSAMFLLVATPFGVWHSAAVLLAVPAGVLTGLAFAAPVMAFAARTESDAGFVLIYRLGVIPLFLFSGTFFPVSQLPGPLSALATLTPLWHGVALCRSLALGTGTPAGLAGHAAYLLAWVVAGCWLGLRAFRWRLVR